jgi:hypothetical protein
VGLCGRNDRDRAERRQASIRAFRNPAAPGLWQKRVLLNEEFYHALLDHPVPLSEAALRAIGPRSMVIDVYIWLAYRLHALRKDVEVGWPALYAQFGAGFARLRDFRAPSVLT